MSADHWPSTKGLSVFNALKVKPMNPPEIRAFIRANWGGYDVGDEYVKIGIEFLLEHSFIQMSGEAYTVIKRDAFGNVVPLVRRNRDRDLAYAY